MFGSPTQSGTQGKADRHLIGKLTSRVQAEPVMMFMRTAVVSIPKPERLAAAKSRTFSRMARIWLAAPLVCMAQVQTPAFQDVRALLSACVTRQAFADIGHDRLITYSDIQWDGHSLRWLVSGKETKDNAVLSSSTTAVSVPLGAVRVSTRGSILLFECIEGKCIRFSRVTESSGSSTAISGCADSERLLGRIEAMRGSK